MRLSDQLAAIQSAFEHRLRALLTLVGVAIGAGSIVLLASLVHGGEQALIDTDQEVSDRDVVEVHPEDVPARARDKTTRPLSRADAAALRDGRATGAGAIVAAEGSFDTWARHRDRRKRVAIVSANLETPRLYRLTVERGRFLDEIDRREGRRVCVIGHEVYETLLEGTDEDARARLGAGHGVSTAGLRLEVDGALFSVVGVLAKKTMLGSTDSTYLWDRKVLVPETTYDAMHAPAHDVARIYVRRPGARPEQIVPLRAAVTAVLLRRHLGVANFTAAKDDAEGQADLIITIIGVLLLGTGLFSMLASGVNIMNVMLVTVSERTREIGLRRALGATRRRIVIQFLIEAAALAGAGGLVGVAGGVAAAFATAAAARAAIGSFDLVIQPWAIALGLGLALVTGVAFGLAPAWRAAQVSPIDALRSE